MQIWCAAYIWSLTINKLTLFALYTYTNYHICQLLSTHLSTLKCQAKFLTDNIFFYYFSEKISFSKADDSHEMSDLFSFKNKN